jgi:hypothetical protein
MRFTEIISESSGTRLKDIAKIATNMPDADFWLVRKGSDKTVGKPLKEFDPSRIGIKVVKTDVIDPNYLYYAMMNLHNQGHFARIANGTTNLVNITVNDIANIPLGQQGMNEAKDPWKEYEFIYDGQKIGHIYSRTGQPPFTTRRKDGNFIKQMNHKSLKDAQMFLINTHLGRSTYDNMSHYGTTPQQGIDEDWNKVNKKDKTSGMSRKAVKAYRRENPGSKLQTAVTTKPSKLKPGSKAAKRRKSFCARMSGNKGPMKKPNGKPTPKALALRRWNCESVEQMEELVMLAEQYIRNLKK